MGGNVTSDCTENVNLSFENSINNIAMTMNIVSSVLWGGGYTTNSQHLFNLIGSKLTPSYGEAGFHIIL